MDFANPSIQSHLWRNNDDFSTDQIDRTLRKAIEDLRLDEDPDGSITEAMSKTSAYAIDVHDAVHLVFGCGTSLRDEVSTHV